MLLLALKRDPEVLVWPPNPNEPPAVPKVEGWEVAPKPPNPGLFWFAAPNKPVCCWGWGWPNPNEVFVLVFVAPNPPKAGFCWLAAPKVVLAPPKEKLDVVVVAAPNPVEGVPNPSGLAGIFLKFDH